MSFEMILATEKVSGRQWDASVFADSDDLFTKHVR